MTQRTFIQMVILLPLVVLLVMVPAIATIFSTFGRFFEFALLPYALFAGLLLYWLRFFSPATLVYLLYRAPLLFFVFLNLYLLERFLVGSFAMPDFTSFGLLLFATDAIGLMFAYAYALVAEQLYHHYFPPSKRNALRA